MLKPAVLRNTALLLLASWGPRSPAQTPGPTQAARTGATRGFETQQPAAAGVARPDTFSPLTTVMAKHRLDVETQRGLLALRASATLSDVALISLVQDDTFCRLKPQVRVAYLAALVSSAPGAARDGLLTLVRQPRVDFAPAPAPSHRSAVPTPFQALMRNTAGAHLSTLDGSERTPFDPAAATSAALFLDELGFPDHQAVLLRLPEAQQLEAIRYVQGGVMPAVGILMGLECWNQLGADDQKALVTRLTTLSANPAGVTAMGLLLKSWALKQDPGDTALQLNAVKTLIAGRPTRELVLPPLTIHLDRLVKAEYRLGPAQITTRGYLNVLEIDGRRISIFRPLRMTPIRSTSPPWSSWRKRSRTCRSASERGRASS